MPQRLKPLSGIMYPCILFALRREAQPFYRLFKQRRRLSPAPCPAWLCGTALNRVIVLETGVGAERSDRALHWFTDTYLPGQNLLQPLSVVSAGFSGALHQECRVGDVVVATEVIDSSGRRWRCDPAVTTSRAAVNCLRGPAFCSPHLVGDPEEKAALGQRFGALAVDMESAVVARFCATRNIPSTCVRAISDDLRTPLSSRLTALLSGAEVQIPRVVAGLARTPSLFFELCRLARDTRRASNGLAQVLSGLLGMGGHLSCQGNTRRGT